MRTVRRLRSGECESGAATVEMVIAFPLFLLLILAAVQFALWEHAEHLAQTAAADALAVARSYGGTAADGQNQAAAILAAADHGALRDIAVSVSRGGAVVSVTVSGSADAVIPWLHFSVSSTASGPAEVFRP